MSAATSSDAVRISRNDESEFYSYWQDAEMQNYPALVSAATELARLDERIAGLEYGSEVVPRLAAREASNISWSDGSSVPLERLSLYSVSRVGAGEGDSRGLMRAEWACRRLFQSSANLGTPAGISRFLGVSLRRKSGESIPDIAGRATGIELERLLEQWLRYQTSLSDLHPITRSAAAYFLWRDLEISKSSEILEPAVIASRIAGQRLAVLKFAPLAFSDRAAFRSLGHSPSEKLSSWLRRMSKASKAARLEVRSLESWLDSATELLRHQSGRTIPLLIKALLIRPVLSSRMLVDGYGVSRASAIRALSTFEDAGLTKELTGAGRFRFWTTNLQR